MSINSCNISIIVINIGFINLISSVPIVLVGNKTDLHQERAVSFDEGKRLAEQWKAVFVETSAKQNESVDEIFLQLLNLIEKESNGSNPQAKGSCIIS